MGNDIRKAISLLDPRGRRQLIVLTALMTVGAALEGVGVGLVAPLIALLSKQGDTSSVFVWLRGLVAAESTTNLVVVACGAIAGIFLLKNLFLAAMYRYQYRFVFGQYESLSRRLFGSYMRRDYSFHLSREIGALLRTVNEEALYVFLSVMTPALSILVEGMVIATLVSVLVVVDPLSAITMLATVGGAGSALYFLMRRRLTRLGADLQQDGARMVKAVNEGLGGVREVKVLGREQYFIENYMRGVHGFAETMWRFRALSDYPRLLIETLAVLGMVAIALGTSRSGAERSLPVLGLFAVAGIRLMPSANRIVTALASIRFYKPAFDRVSRDVSAANDDRNAVSADTGFSAGVELKDVRFRYPGAKQEAVAGLSLGITRGSSVALVGPSGGGKSTVLDLLLGLLKPDSGSVEVDGADVKSMVRSWQRRIGFIPQPVFVLDDSIRRNVAFGIPDAEIDEARVKRAVLQARLGGVVERANHGLDTIVGERGVGLSGGERQRVGIARALYHDPEVLVMDEGTSALDPETEAEIVAEIMLMKGTRTLILVAHRLQTVQNCDRLFYIETGTLVAQGSFRDLMEKSAQFRSLVQAGTLASSHG